MTKYTYIVFGESGCVISRLLKENNRKNRIIHFYEGISLFGESSADKIINLHENIVYNLGSDFNHYDYIIDNQVQKKNKRIN